MTLNTWTLCRKELPPEDVEVIVLAPSGEELVMFRKGRLWFIDGGEMYVYWEPLVWRPIRE
jgi:hypothetical protein